VSAEENWSVVPLDQGFLLVNRERRPLPQAVIKQINQLLLRCRYEKEKGQFVYSHLT